MPTYKLTVIELRRMVVLVEAPTLAEAHRLWSDGKILELKTIEVDVIDSVKVPS